MTALAADRRTDFRAGDYFEYPVAANKEIFQGALVVLDASGNAEPATTATGKVAVGIAQTYVKNGATAAAVKVAVRSGVFKLANGEAIDKTSIGDMAYALDDQTVYKTGTGKSPVGIIVDVETDGVWVMVKPPFALDATGFAVANNLSEGTAATMRSNLGLEAGTASVSLNDVAAVTAEVTGLSTLSGGMKTDADAAAPVVYTDVITVTATQLRKLAAAPKELVAAPGATKALVFRRALLSYRGGSNAFDSVGAGEDLAVRYENGSGALVSASLDTTTDINFGATTDSDATLPALGTVVVAPKNKSLVLDNVGAGELAAADADANGDGIVTVVIEYEVHTVVA